MHPDEPNPYPQEKSAVPEDQALKATLVEQAERANGAVNFHRIELERAERVLRSCHAALNQLDAPAQMPDGLETATGMPLPQGMPAGTKPF